MPFKRDVRIGFAIMILLCVAVFLIGYFVGKATGATTNYGYASWYGPGLYGNHTACGGRLYPGTWGVAHKWLPCGSKVRICYTYRCVNVSVIDRGPFVYGREFDLTGPVAQHLCRCSSWGVRQIIWRRLR